MRMDIDCFVTYAFLDLLVYSAMVTSSSPVVTGAAPAAPSAAGCSASWFCGASPSSGPSSDSPLLLLHALSSESTSSFSQTRKLPRRAAPEFCTFATSSLEGPIMAIEVFAIVRCLSCCSVSARADRPWLIKAGRSAGIRQPELSPPIECGRHCEQACFNSPPVDIQTHHPQSFQSSSQDKSLHSDSSLR